jgi:hypothetical protein
MNNEFNFPMKLLGVDMRKAIAKSIISIALVGFCAHVFADVLPKSGEIKLQSIYKGAFITKFNDDYSHGAVTGVTFNELGKGPLHMGKVACSFSIFSRDGIKKVIGFCTHEDKNGDEIFIQYAGNSSIEGEWNGTDDIIGGTGKYKGIQGSGPYACTHSDKEGEFPCTAKIEYLLP